MRATQTRGKTALWIAVVYLLSFLCYVPVLLERAGASVPDALLMASSSSRRWSPPHSWRGSAA